MGEQFSELWDCPQRWSATARAGLNLSKACFLFFHIDNSEITSFKMTGWYSLWWRFIIKFCSSPQLDPEFQYLSAHELCPNKEASWFEGCGRKLNWNEMVWPTKPHRLVPAFLLSPSNQSCSRDTTRKFVCPLVTCVLLAGKLSWRLIRWTSCLPAPLTLWKNKLSQKHNESWDRSAREGSTCWSIEAPEVGVLWRATFYSGSMSPLPSASGSFFNVRL